MIIINDNDTCSVCGAYFQGNGYCTNGHNKLINSPNSITKWEYKNELEIEKE